MKLIFICRPKFDRPKYFGAVRENSSPGTPVELEHPIKIFDADEGPNRDFMVILRGEGSGKFQVDPATGKIFVGNFPLDREEKQMYSLKLIATDRGNLSTSAVLELSIIDINDNP